MRYEWAKLTLRRRVQSPRTWAFLRRVLVTFQYIARQPDEPEVRHFRALEALPDRDLLFVDIGANGGQTAVGIARVLPTARIASFEPNPALTAELAWVRRLIGKRYSQYAFGLGSKPGSMTLHVPHVGNLSVTTRASLLAEVAGERVAGLEDETGRAVVLRPVEVEIRRFDDLGLDPHGVKIDVEGAELAVLGGMTDTLRRCRPMLMLEYGAQVAECRALLLQLGYDFWDIDPRTRTLVPAGHPTIRNWFAIPPHPALRHALGLNAHDGPSD